MRIGEDWVYHGMMECSKVERGLLAAAGRCSLCHACTFTNKLPRLPLPEQVTAQSLDGANATDANPLDVPPTLLMSGRYAAAALLAELAAAEAPADPNPDTLDDYLFGATALAAPEGSGELHWEAWLAVQLPAMVDKSLLKQTVPASALVAGSCFCLPLGYAGA